MYRLLRNTLLTLGFVALIFPAAASGQLREIVAKNVSASSSGTALSLEFADRGSLEIRFERGIVYVDGESVGVYEPGGELDAAWRRLVGDAMGLENGALASALVDWNAPRDLSAVVAETAREVDRAIEEGLRDTDTVVLEGQNGSVRVSAGDQSGVLRALLGSARRLGLLEEAMSGLDGDFAIYLGEDVLISEDSVVEGTLVVIDGTLRVEGEVTGDVVVVGGALDIREAGIIRGEARVADSRVLRNDGEVDDGIVDVLEGERTVQAELRDRLRNEIREEVRNDLRNELRNVTRGENDSFSIMAPFRPVIRGVGGVLEKLIIVFVLGLVGAGFLTFAGENLDTIAETARRAPGRAAMVGFAGSFLLIPVWILGTVALVVSIIGIPVAIAWLPLFPVAAALAGLLGYVAVARNAGEWLADSRWPWTGWIRKSNPIMTLFGGLLGLSLAFMAGHVISMAPFLGVFSAALFLIGGFITLFAIQIGFGAVLLTRAGRRREYYGAYDADAAWAAAMDIDVEEDVTADAKGQTGDVAEDAGEDHA